MLLLNPSQLPDEIAGHCGHRHLLLLCSGFGSGTYGIGAGSVRGVVSGSVGPLTKSTVPGVGDGVSSNNAGWNT
jgi:hypothetical protein